MEESWEEEAEMMADIVIAHNDTKAAYDMVANASHPSVGVWVPYEKLARFIVQEGGVDLIYRLSRLGLPNLKRYGIRKLVEELRSPSELEEYDYYWDNEIDLPVIHDRSEVEQIMSDWESQYTRRQETNMSIDDMG